MPHIETMKFGQNHWSLMWIWWPKASGGYAVRTICDRRAGERGGGAPAAQDSQERAGQGGRRRGSLHFRSRNTSWPTEHADCQFKPPIINSNRRLSIQNADYQLKPPIIKWNRRLSSHTADYHVKPLIINSDSRLLIQTADYQFKPPIVNSNRRLLIIPANYQFKPPIINSNRRWSIQTADYQYEPPIINSNRRLSSQTADYQFISPIIKSNRRLLSQTADYQSRRLSILSIQTADYQSFVSRIRCLIDPWIWDPGWESESWIRIQDEQPGSYFRELRNQIFWVKILKLFDVDPGWRKFGSVIRDRENSDPWSGMENIRIRDKHPGSATLRLSLPVFRIRGILRRI